MTIYNVQTSVVGEWAKKGDDIKNSDMVVLLDSGRSVESSFKNKDGGAQFQEVFSVKTKNGAKNISLNRTSINAIVSEYGADSKSWIGKELFVHSIKQSVAGKFLDVYYFVPFGYEMGEYGFERSGVQPAAKQELPIIQVEEEEDELSKVPF